mmetsp:Transcript_20629/g.62976  ORF Transcript_20629/g.62976 Transcript_20629/m.62976 type:complete len:258 (-) Transcript_20629:506-1279(-)
MLRPVRRDRWPSTMAGTMSEIRYTPRNSKFSMCSFNALIAPSERPRRAQVPHVRSSVSELSARIGMVTKRSSIDSSVMMVSSSSIPRSRLARHGIERGIALAKQTTAALIASSSIHGKGMSVVSRFCAEKRTKRSDRMDLRGTLANAFIKAGPEDPSYCTKVSSRPTTCASAPVASKLAKCRTSSSHGNFSSTLPANGLIKPSCINSCVTFPGNDSRITCVDKLCARMAKMSSARRHGRSTRRFGQYSAAHLRKPRT